MYRVIITCLYSLSSFRYQCTMPLLRAYIPCPHSDISVPCHYYVLIFLVLIPVPVYHATITCLYSLLGSHSGTSVPCHYYVLIFLVRFSFRYQCTISLLRAYIPCPHSGTSVPCHYCVLIFLVLIPVPVYHATITCLYSLLGSH